MLFLHLAYHSLLDGHPVKRCKYGTLRSDCFWCNMSMDVYSKVRYRQDYPRMGTNFKHQRRSHLFPPSSLPECFAVNILGPLLWTWSCKQFWISITERYSKRVWAVPTQRTSSSHVAQIILNDRAIQYGIRDVLLSDNDQTFVRTLFSSICRYLGVKTDHNTSLPSTIKRKGEAL